MGKGFVSLVGAGPGRADLITIAGLRRLRRADVVLYDRLIDSRLLAEAPADAERIFAGKRAGEHLGIEQSEINELMIQRARQGKRVVRLKGGDPLFFARGSEEAEALRAADVAFEIIPGVTAASAVAACAGVPMTHRERASAVAWFTGHEDPSKRDRLEWSKLAAFPGTLVAYMGVTRLQAICRALTDAGKPAATPVAVVEWGGLNRQRIDRATLGEFADGRPTELGSPGLIVIGAVVDLRDRIEWFSHRPLSGLRVAIARPSGGRPSALSLGDVENVSGASPSLIEPADRAAAATFDRLEELGAVVHAFPVVAIEAAGDAAPLDAAIEGLDRFDWVAFTSPNGVEHFLSRLMELGYDVRKFGGVQLAAIGPGTAAALARWRLHADLLPKDYRSEGLVEAMLPNVRGRRVLLVRADRGRTLLEEMLSETAEVVRVAAYRQRDLDPPQELFEIVRSGRLDWVLLTSAQIAAGFLRWIAGDAEVEACFRRHVRIGSISPVTTAAIQKAGFVPEIEATEFTPDGLIDKLIEWASGPDERMETR